ncbi:MAG: hypothetical protein FVQ79_07505 [Planctomycetes bacterium]|nr:hypothetical protein [Planctomycetota bacterium]
MDGDGEIVIFLTGETVGQLKPCGCAADQLGGFEKRKTVLDTVDSERRLVVDTGHLVDGRSEQDILKYETIVHALFMLGYDAVNLDASDVEIARNSFGLANMPFAIISGSDESGEVKRSYTKILKMNGTVLPVTVGSIRSDQVTAGEVEKLFSLEGDIPGLNILLVDSCDDAVLETIAQAVDVVDVVVCPFGSDEAEIVAELPDAPLVISAGRLGKYVGKLRVKLLEGKLEFAYEKIAIDGTLKPDEELVQLYSTYQQTLKDDNYLAKVSKVPLPGGLKYAGSDKCHGCHEYNNEKWSNLKHAHAYQTLVDVTSQYDPECIKCHVVGFGYESGFSDENSSKGLRNVGCETCHGPRSQHIEDALNDDISTKKAEPVAVVSCIECHTSEHSPDYQTDVRGYWGKIVHWKEPKQNSPVK